MQIKTIASEWLRLLGSMREVIEITTLGEKELRFVFYYGALSFVKCLDDSGAAKSLDDLMAELKRFKEESDA